jgi:hypothetical protein
MLLRHTPVPLTEEYAPWRIDTRTAARGIVAKLRAAGFQGSSVVLQWLPLREVAEIMGTWSCRYEGDAARRAQLTAIAERYAADERFLATRARFQRQTAPRAANVRPPFASSVEELHALRRWYDAMAPCWLRINPLVRRALVLRSHRWITDRVLVPVADGQPPALEDLEPSGGLSNTLAALIPPDEQAAWRPWIDLVVSDLKRALRRPVANWNQAWGRWLFLIVYSIPAPGATSGAGPAASRAVRTGELTVWAKPMLAAPSTPAARGA